MDNLATPFETEVFGVPVTMERVKLTEAGQLVALCRGKRCPAGDRAVGAAAAQPAADGRGVDRGVPALGQEVGRA